MTDGYQWQKFDQLPMPKFLAFEPVREDEPATSVAYDEGFDKGYQEGMAKAAAEAATAAERWRTLTDEMTTIRAELVAETLRDMSDALRRTYFAIFKRELMLGEGELQSLVDKLVARLNEKRHVLHAHPDDIEWLQRQLNVETIAADASLAPGSLRAVTEAGFAELHVFEDLETLIDQAFADFTHG